MKLTVLKGGLSRVAPVVIGAAAPVLAMAPRVFAAEPVVGADALDSVVVTSDMLKPVIDAITSNIGIILPVGIILFGIMLGIGLVPRIFKKFSSGS